MTKYTKKVKEGRAQKRSQDRMLKVKKVYPASGAELPLIDRHAGQVCVGEISGSGG